jgi:putative ABC transport system permease protein
LIALRNLAAQRQQSTVRPASNAGLPPDTQALAENLSRLWNQLSQSNIVFITKALALRHSLSVGSQLPVVINEHVVSLSVGGLLPSDPSRPAPPAELLLMDLPALQELTGRTGVVDRIEFVLEPGPRQSERWASVRSQLEKLAQLNPTDPVRWKISSSADRRAGADTMTRAFRLNLTILSMLALFVGLYLVFQALDGAVVRRRQEIAILRSLGVSPGDIQKAWLIEATVLGIVGGLAGLALGWAGAQGAVRLVGRTVNALYYASAADSAALSWSEAIVALLMAIFASVVAGWIPARAAALTPPAQMASRGSAATYAGARWLQRPSLGLLFLIGGTVFAMLPAVRLEGGGRLALAAYVAAVLWVFGASFLAGPLLAWIGRHGRRFELAVPLKLALSHLRQPSGRHRLAAAGLVCAIAMTAGMAILVGSFETTMKGWIQRTFQADLYISSDGAQSASTENRISPATWKRLVEHPSIARANPVQVLQIALPAGTTMLFAGDLEFFRTVAHPAWLQAPLSEAVFKTESNEALALVSESFCERFQLSRGDPIDIPTPVGPKRVVISGSFSDYGNERGSILIDRHHFVNWFGNEMVSSLIVQLKPGSDPAAVRAEFRASYPGLAVYTNEYLRTEALRIFRQTFSITYALELIGIVVAVAGLGFTLASLLWERRADLTTLRALGLRRSELAAATAWEGVLTAAAGVAVGLLASLALGWLLIQRVNKQTFGWTLQTDLPWFQLAFLGFLVLMAAAATGWATGRWGAQLPAEKEE